MKKILSFTIIIILILLLAKPFLYWQNDTVGITNYTIKDAEIPSEFDGYKIVMLADIHGKEFGEDNKDLISKIEKQKADILVIAGDLFDEGVLKSEAVIDGLAKNLKSPKDIYAVSGNHDKWSSRFNELINHWEGDLGIEFLENESITIKRNNQTINLHGISDPSIWDDEKSTNLVQNSISKMNLQDGFNILLFHRANMLDLFNDKNFDLVLSGHMHGGQVGIPFVGGLKSPHGDWLPKYSGGRYNVNEHTYIVSRGIGNAVSVPRIFNRPEIVTIKLKVK